MRVVKSASILACVLALTAGCGLEMGGLSAEVPQDDADTPVITADAATTAPEAAPPPASDDGGGAAADAVAPSPDASSAPEAQAPVEAGPTGPPPPPPPPPKGPGKDGEDGGDAGSGKGH